MTSDPSLTRLAVTPFPAVAALTCHAGLLEHRPQSLGELQSVMVESQSLMAITPLSLDRCFLMINSRLVTGFLIAGRRPARVFGSCSRLWPSDERGVLLSLFDPPGGKTIRP